NSAVQGSAFLISYPLKGAETQNGGSMTSGRGQLTPQTAFAFIVCLVVLAIICQLAATVHGSWIEPPLWLALGLAIGIACRELGHLLGAAIGSIPIRLVAVGVGPLLWRRRFGETWFELRLLPDSGFVSAYPVVDSRWYRWALFLLGGVMGNVAVIFLVAGVGAGGGAPGPAGGVLWPRCVRSIVPYHREPFSFSAQGGRHPDADRRAAAPATAVAVSRPGGATPRGLCHGAEQVQQWKLAAHDDLGLVSHFVPRGVLPTCDRREQPPGFPGCAAA